MYYIFDHSDVAKVVKMKIFSVKSLIFDLYRTLTLYRSSLRRSKGRLQILQRNAVLAIETSPMILIISRERLL